MATALITGASSGIGRDFAILLSRKGYNLILVGRSLSRLEAVLPKLSHKRVRLLALDLSKPEHCYELYRQCQSESVELLINNAGFGQFGEFARTKLETELNMIDLNIRAVQILTKLFLREMGVDVSRLQVTMEVHSTDSIRRMVAQGLGIAVMSRAASAADCQAHRLLAFDFDSVSLRRKLYLVRQKNGILSPVAQAFYDFAREYYKK